ncbi:NUDIX domain-containing protein [Candidatus Pacearchaeota archaeon]|nr:NUDIX domain-containing protein [Candidatus Pacearchaeota archaeon]MBI2057067.1 NUDIX domain-containing protein [Candidatus Pacearchaeota archaeon]
MEKYKKSVIAILVNSKKQILLHLRDDKPGILAPGCWAFIGGSVEDGESELEGIKREVKEEINYSINNFQYLDKFHLRKDDLNVLVYIGRLDVPEEEIKLTEGQCVRFFYPTEIKNLKMSNVLKKVTFRNLKKIISIANN